MKKLVFLFSLLLIITGCSDNNDSIDVPQEELQLKQSLSFRVTLEEIRSTYDPNGRNSNELCFNFVYPVEVQYNDGSTVTVVDFDHLLQLVIDETLALHITGVGFPLDVVLSSNGETMNIPDEADFQDLIISCGYDAITIPEIMAFVDDCFTINYPVTLIVNDVPLNFNSEQEIEDYFLNNSGSVQTVVVGYPFSVTLVDTNELMVIQDDFELVNLVSNICGIGG